MRRARVPGHFSAKGSPSQPMTLCSAITTEQGRLRAWLSGAIVLRSRDQAGELPIYAALGILPCGVSLSTMVGKIRDRADAAWECDTPARVAN